MGRPLKLTTDLAEAMCEYARQGMPVGRASALCDVHRVSAQRWLREGAGEVDAAGEDEDAVIGMRGQFAIDFEGARAAYLLGLLTKWQERIDKQDYNTAKVIAAMMASQAPDEYSERRATRTIDQRTTLQGEIGVTRYASMSTEDLDAERQRIEARRTAAKVDVGDDWRDAVVARLPEEKTLNQETAERSLLTVKRKVGGKPDDHQAFSQNIPPSRAQGSDALVEADQAEFVAAALAPSATGEGGVVLARSLVPPSRRCRGYERC